MNENVMVEDRSINVRRMLSANVHVMGRIQDPAFALPSSMLVAPLCSGEH